MEELESDVLFAVRAIDTCHKNIIVGKGVFYAISAKAI
jgi:hypothetical protein